MFWAVVLSSAGMQSLEEEISGDTREEVKSHATQKVRELGGSFYLFQICHVEHRRATVIWQDDKDWLPAADQFLPPAA